ncbi:hypothetical protein BJ684DRAFT_22839 [Piptocephalis cylindrospora]|uniref:NEDD8-activating enzyme E1 catalytic subunit n=1 Tax=Piptocephalis cylindrospora TaxID=1907219 RepID=A0A4V1IY45_9FUNG|nr:hypothetical protein BJ684DRAFT_22839 [Piptocephalis cylindrospora]|eukprot:RKP13279.1 hypothetical protein BJ684DRAFT_22839 [Piptocephalis cylindrospora]
MAITPQFKRFLGRPGPWTEEEDDPAGEVDRTVSFLESARVLVIGAGGLGCEILKNLLMSGVRNVDVIDMDTVDVSNLNRQFLFRPKDVGRPKAVAAAEFLQARTSLGEETLKVTPHYCKIQDKDEAFYASFHLVICGLDSVEARRWINGMLVDLVDPQNPESIKPLIDGGTEGFKGQARVIIPGSSSCYECSLDILTPQRTYPICTLANTPPWPLLRPDIRLDTDHPDHQTWIYTQALTRAKEFGIIGVTLSLTQGVIKNIIPAIASTNAIIAAACTVEALKLLTSTAPYLDNYMLYTGDQGVYTYTFQHQRKEDCPVCGPGGASREVKVDPSWTLEDWMDDLKHNPQIQLSKPSLRVEGRNLYMQAPPFLEKVTRPNLYKEMRRLVQEGEEVIVTDARLPIHLTLRIQFREDQRQGP